LNPLLAAVDWLVLRLTAYSQLKEWEAFREEFNNIGYSSSGMGCGLEDRGITYRYEACAFGWEQAMEQVAELFPEE